MLQDTWRGPAVPPERADVVDGGWGPPHRGRLPRADAAPRPRSSLEARARLHHHRHPGLQSRGSPGAGRRRPPRARVAAALVSRQPGAGRRYYEMLWMESQVPMGPRPHEDIVELPEGRLGPRQGGMMLTAPGPRRKNLRLVLTARRVDGYSSPPRGGTTLRERPVGKRPARRGRVNGPVRSGRVMDTGDGKAGGGRSGGSRASAAVRSAARALGV